MINIKDIALFENLVILELMKFRLNQGLEPQLYFFRDQRRNEVHIIYKSANTLIPVEIKARQTFHREFLKGIDYFKKLVGDRCMEGFLIYSGELEKTIHDITLLNYRDAMQVAL